LAFARSPRCGGRPEDLAGFLLDQPGLERALDGVQLALDLVDRPVELDLELEVEPQLADVGVEVERHHRTPASLRHAFIAA
jgi:hypothetical protein